MAWLLLAGFAQFLNAIVAVLDKYIVSDENALPRPFVYAFYSCLVTGFWVVIYFIGLIPGLDTLGFPQFANVQQPTIQVVGMSFLAAYTFFIALVSMYDALKHAKASNVMPVIGAVGAIASFGMTYLFFGGVLSDNFIYGIALLTIGTVLISSGEFKSNTILQTIHSGIFFALHLITMKGLFIETSFDDGFFWSRISFVLFALSLLLVPAYLEKIKKQTTTTTKKAGFLVLANKVLAGIAAFLLLKATDMGNESAPAVIQATDGLKFVFIILITYVFASWVPESAAENESRPSQIIQKLLSIAVIVIGFFILFT